MDSMISYIDFICIVVPLMMMIFVLTGKSRHVVGFMIVGVCACMLVSEINGIIVNITGISDMYYITTAITPLTEEIIKAVPVIFYALVISNDKKTLLSISFACGVGFAVLENTVILSQSVISNPASVSFLWAFVRGFGSGLMHAVCTMAVGYGISIALRKRKLMISGTFAILATVAIYHATYNSLVQSKLPYLGFLLPLMTFIPILIVQYKRRKKSAELDGDSASA